jgi:hypothetical protein
MKKRRALTKSNTIFLELHPFSMTDIYKTMEEELRSAKRYNYGYTERHLTTILFVNLDERMDVCLYLSEEITKIIELNVFMLQFVNENAFGFPVINS